MPTVLTDGPYRFSFFGIDRNESPHVHVTRDRAQAKFWLDPVVRLARNAGFRPHELREIERIIVTRRLDLLEAWHAFFNR